MAKGFYRSICSVILLHHIIGLNVSGLQYYHLNTRTSDGSFGREEWQAIIFGYKNNLYSFSCIISPPAMEPSFRKIYFQDYYGGIGAGPHNEKRENK